MSMSGRDREVLRGLARQVAEIGHLPDQERRRQMWRRHNRLEKVKPMVLVFPEGSWEEILPRDSMVTRDPVAREYEWRLRQLVYRWEHLRDDNVVEPRINVPVVPASRSGWHGHALTTGWGLSAETISSDAERGAERYDPPLKEPEDFAKMRFPEINVDWDETQRRLDLVRDAIGDLIEVRLKRILRFNVGLIDDLAWLRGADTLMLDMCLRPEWVHEVLSFMTEGTLRVLDQAEAEGLLDLGNEDDYVGSGGVGYSDELPAPDFDGQHVRTRDLWGFADAQQFVQVSPSMHEEFALQYQRKLLARFGLNCYGCCEPLDGKWDRVMRLPRLRRVSVSPWANVWEAAEALEDKVIFSWKPQPAEILLHDYEEVIRRSIAETLQAASGCVLEMILKDTHTCNHEPERLETWVRTANEMAAG